MKRIALVHHANQYIITDGYENRDGLSRILDGYEAVLEIHERHSMAINLHLSGTLLEAIAWHRPPFLERVSDLVAGGLVTLIGGTYAENVMPLFSDEFNRAQIIELFDLYETLLGCPPPALRAFWVPERVWDPRLAEVITDPSLPNNGYRFVLLDDRLAFPPGPARRSFDRAGPWAGGGWSTCVQPFLIDKNLTVLPISAQLRYRIPPGCPRDLLWIGESDGSLFIYADDLEKVAGVGGWSNDIADYERFLRWLSDNPDLTAIHLDEIGPARAERTIEAGTFYELACAWNANEDYSGWADSPAWAPYAGYLQRAENEIRSATGAHADEALIELAHKHLLASAHETAWHDEVDGGRAPAPWARALASHARSVHPVLVAARSLPTAEKPIAYSADVDADGIDEILLGLPGAMSVLAPRYGGRLVYLFHDGVMSVGNPTDHYNFQEELNKFMSRPPNHPGAMVDVGAEDDVFEVANLDTIGDLAVAELANHDVHKKIALGSDPPGVVACYSSERAVEVSLSPDYLRLLRAGRRLVATSAAGSWRCVRAGDVSVWVAIDRRETDWSEPRAAEIGHGLNFAVRPLTTHWHFAIGWGPVDNFIAGRLLDTATLLHD